jgi:DNA-binding transcriptional MerR regulator
VAAPDKAADAFRTIGELSRETGVPQHILRYWETRFPQLRPLQRAGNRRYYRAEDAALVRRIQTLLSTEGYTIRGVQKLLGEEAPAPAVTSPPGGAAPTPELIAIRDRLAAALADGD